VSDLSCTVEALRLTSRDTDQAIYISNPTSLLQCLFLPRAAITHMSKIEGQPGWWSIDLPENLATEKGII
jgi:hypothetical protein